MKPKRHHSDTARRLYRIEDSVNAILKEVGRISVRLYHIEQQQRNDFTDRTINQLHTAADRMAALADIELQKVKQLYGKRSI